MALNQWNAYPTTGRRGRRKRKETIGVCSCWRPSSSSFDELMHSFNRPGCFLNTLGFSILIDVDNTLQQRKALPLSFYWEQVRFHFFSSISITLTVLLIMLSSTCGTELNPDFLEQRNDLEGGIGWITRLFNFFTCARRQSACSTRQSTVNRAGLALVTKFSKSTLQQSSGGPKQKCRLLRWPVDEDSKQKQNKKTEHGKNNKFEIDSASLKSRSSARKWTATEKNAFLEFWRKNKPAGSKKPMTWRNRNRFHHDSTKAWTCVQLQVPYSEFTPSQQFGSLWCECTGLVSRRSIVTHAQLSPINRRIGDVVL